jgi:hypothetical protein
MMQLIRLGLIATLICALAACGLRYIDAPPVTAEDRWIKNGLTKNDIYRALIACGYDRSSRNEAQRAEVDKCMLSGGFIFIDSPYGQQGAICKYPEYQNRPSCQSIHSHRK